MSVKNKILIHIILKNTIIRILQKNFDTVHK